LDYPNPTHAEWMGEGAIITNSSGISVNPHCRSGRAGGACEASVEMSRILSAFFALVGCHGSHVASGLVWLVDDGPSSRRGFAPAVQRRLLCFALFWHALDIVWAWLSRRST
jgi:hypothetical protein